MKTSVQGYPRIGRNREWKRLLESYWSGELSEASFEQEMKKVRINRLKDLQESGLDLIPVGDFSLYDHMLDTAVMFGMVPERYKGPAKNSLETYFAMARGSQSAPACEMTKWFNTNYHYIVPEVESGWVPEIVENKPLTAFKEAEEALGIKGKPVLTGPYTFIKLAKGLEEEELEGFVMVLVSLYAKIIAELHEAGAPLIQMDEPALVLTMTEAEMTIVEKTYARLAELVPDAPLLLQTYFDSVSFPERVFSLPVDGIGLDLVHDNGRNRQALQENRGRKKRLALGVIDGRNIWKSDLEAVRRRFPEMLELAADVILQPSCSLLHVPVSLASETDMEASRKKGLAFAEEKLGELALLQQGPDAPDWNEHQQELAEFYEAHRQADEERSVPHAGRAVPYAERKQLHQEKWQLPLLPTTTIGSFPQSADVRRTRSAYRRGEVSEAAYSSFIREKIEHWIQLQEDIGLDVFVHGEFERNDMVEFFGERLDGFLATQNGWVQSYGSRCVKPPVIFEEIRWEKPMTVEETTYAQSLTDKPLKGMLTGPVTIINWSFIRDDLPKETMAAQTARALQKEIRALEEGGIDMIQVDEPALREGLPLKEEDQAAYLDWAVNAFRLTAEEADAKTQIHTHMCYSSFEDMIDAIDAMDADVISIETSRSHGELIHAFETNTYGKGIGLGVYDIHSPRIPEASDMADMIRRALRVLSPEQFWINPDCGLKTRTEQETVDALKNMKKAAEEVRSGQ
ncbi:5-methyltetrahydropteroyltriglutamate--homocysteine S-methyltransferase [Alkalicoccus urumqiensis]|uniref:5-methyltetrahydropteroyltriglutamate--homocysteine methyltransferase n=1 Tax=Alkalicoccus urumqiensis TaxID=1548213 RepID=A0A2P6MLF0_ALKUR|nr:5-methyltetrahydropteroyltriglutamate--homocysteine S-methyltransferase [Alkalicoccus urumqiensis]PRO67109.1 5-methyltetrahydropteroyltriglutamate--homocysteine S-methyltransferase [Alkalicoccus urumqiensis]